MAYLLHLYLQYKNIPHNTPNKQDTKISDILSLCINGITVPNTYFSNGLRIKEDNIEDIINICNLPCIFKTSLGSLGKNVFLIDEKLDIKKTIDIKKKYNKYMFQKYIPNDFDYRIVIANNKPTSACIRRRVNDKYRNNVALGAMESFLNISDIPLEILDIATKSAQVLNLDWAGVDIVTDKISNRHYVLEVNRRPGLTEKSTEIYAFYTHIDSLIYKGNNTLV
jgi:glutathione synthase/RimK-type ligase-like ATP-grasp enzyme